MKFLSKLLTASGSRGNLMKLEESAVELDEQSKASVGCIAALLSPCSPEHGRPVLLAGASDEDGSDSDTDSVGSFIACPVMGAVQYVPVSAPTVRRRTAMDRAPAPCATPTHDSSLVSSGGVVVHCADEASTCDSPAVSFDQQYDSLSLMHRSRHALIYRAKERKTERTVVLKAYPKARLSAAEREAVEREARLMRRAEHPGVVRLLNVVECDDCTYLVQEAATGGTLMEAIANQGGRLSERTAALRVTAPLLRTLQHLHAQGIVHRDIKPEHLLLSPGTGLKLADFHSAAQPGVELEAMNYRVGSIEYMAPEMLSKPSSAEVFHLVLAQGMSEEELPVYDQAVDVWSAGVLTYEALTGYQPFLADSARDMAAVIQQKMGVLVEGVPEFIARHHLSADCTDFLVQALQADPAKRPSAAQLLQHPWLLRWLATAATSRRSMEGAAASAAAEDEQGDSPIRRSATSNSMGLLEGRTPRVVRSLTSQRLDSRGASHSTMVLSGTSGLVVA